MSSGFVVRMREAEEAAYNNWVQEGNVREVPVASAAPWSDDDRRLHETEGTIRDRKIRGEVRTLKVCALITALVATALVFSGFLFSMFALHMAAIAVGAVSFMLLGRVCYLQSRHSLLKTEFAQQKIRKYQVAFHTPLPTEIEEPIPKIVAEQIAISTLRQHDPQSLKHILYDKFRQDITSTIYLTFQALVSDITRDTSAYIMVCLALKHAARSDPLEEIQRLQKGKADRLTAIVNNVQSEWSRRYQESLLKITRARGIAELAFL